MAGTDFDAVWRRVLDLAGEEFTLKRGERFTYRVDGDSVVTSRTDYKLARSNFETAWRLWPLDGPGEIKDVVRGPSYVWAVLADPRVSGQS